ncbi:hypothetical protein G9A89_013445 [Geosiphon pyriformis]|nr:hypothetical protein G9A89_013445 [Geosiphon pyriformis]
MRPHSVFPGVVRLRISQLTKYTPPHMKLSSLEVMHRRFYIQNVVRKVHNVVEPSFNNVPQLSYEDILPSEEQFQAAFKQKFMKVPLETQKEIIKLTFDKIVMSQDPETRKNSEERVFELAGSNLQEIKSLGDLVLKTSKGGALVSLALYKIAMENGDDNAGFNYANMLIQGFKGIPKNTDEGESILTNLARKGHPYAQINLASILINSKRDYESARQLYELAAQGGQAAAWTELGKMYRMGTGIQQNHKKALECFEKGAAGGNRESIFMLGVYASTVYPTLDNKPDQELAFKHFEAAAQKGLPEAQYNVGERYVKGKGVEKNISRAAEYWKMAAFQGFQLAQANLGRMYHEGHGVKQDLNLAKEYYVQAIQRGGAIGEKAISQLREIEKGEKTNDAKKPRRCTIM